MLISPWAKKLVKRELFFFGGVWLIPLLLVTCVCKWISAYLWQHSRLSSTDYSRSGKHAFSILQLRTFPVCVQALRNTCRDGFPTTESFLFPSRKIRQRPGDLHLPHWRCPIYGGTPKLSTWIGFFIIDLEMETPNCFSQNPNGFALQLPAFPRTSAVRLLEQVLLWDWHGWKFHGNIPDTLITLVRVRMWYFQKLDVDSSG
jgi:hypothetical protein